VNICANLASKQIKVVKMAGCGWDADPKFRNPHICGNHPSRKDGVANRIL